MEAMVASLPSQLRWSCTVEMPAVAADRILACGMGGSGIAGDYVQRLANAFGRELTVHKDYGIPPWAYRARPLVVITSYSGNTEEALSSFLAAAEGGLDIVAVTTGGELERLASSTGVPAIGLEPGYQPRAAFGMCFGVMMRIAAAAGLIPDPVAEVKGAAYALEAVMADPPGIIDDVAGHIANRPAHIMAAEPLGAVAYRWKTQFNENANRFASASVVPELTHNELVPIEAGDAPALITLRSEADRAAVTRRFVLMAEMIDAPIVDVHAVGANDVERMLYLTAVGDLASVAAAAAAGVDPVAVRALEEFKINLRER